MIKIKENKDEAMYGKGHAPSGERCALCKFYNPVATARPEAGVCDEVNGIIDPDAYCLNFRPRADKSSAIIVV